MSIISVGGLATGLDTNSIITQLVALEHRPIDLLNGQVSDVQNTQAAVGAFGGKLSAIGSAADALSSLSKVLVRQAGSSNQSVLVASAGEGAARGATTINVTQLARNSGAGGTVGVAAATSTIANGPGTFQFQVGSGALQSISIDATTTLQGLSDAINNLGAGVTASAINLGTDTSPNYRLQLTGQATGAANTIAIVHDDTTLGIQTTQSGQDAQFTVSGFSGTFSRASNTFSDVLPGVTFSLKDTGISTVTVEDNANAITAKVRALVSAFNDAVTFVNSQTDVSVSQDKNTLSTGSLATDSTVRRLQTELHQAFSGTLTGATTQFVNLSSLGIATQKDGTLLFNEGTFLSALATNSTAVAQVLSGNGVGRGLANEIKSFADNATQSGGTLDLHTHGLSDQIRSLQDQIDTSQRSVDAFEANLRQQFADLETTVSNLKAQGSFLTSAFAKAG
jgi:flagellar hook-associated protein 2